MTEREFNELFYAHYKPLVWFAYRMVQDRDDAQEVVQSAFVKVHRANNIHGNEKMIKSYLYSAVHNTACDLIKDRNRNRKSTRERLSEPIETITLSFDQQVEIDLNQLLYGLVNTLPEKCREVFVLILKGYEVGAISKITNANIHTIKNQRARGLKLLRKRMQHLAPAY